MALAKKVNFIFYSDPGKQTTLKDLDLRPDSYYSFISFNLMSSHINKNQLSFIRNSKMYSFCAYHGGKKH